MESECAVRIWRGPPTTGKMAASPPSAGRLSPPPASARTTYQLVISAPRPRYPQLVCPVCRACPHRTSMFMFRRRRAALVRSLLKNRVRKKDEAVDEEVRRLLMKRLGDCQLEDLLRAVETKGGTAACVLLEPPASCDPALLSCRTWRWPDLETSAELKKLPVCKSSAHSLCCNPYHWSRLCSPESPPPPYSRFCSERLKPEDRAPSESSQLELRGSLSTNGEGEVHSGWCRLAYWELSKRVGRQFPVFNQSVNVFWSLPHGDGLSLRTLAANQQQPSPPSTVLKARDKIGKGVTLSKEEDGIWAFNRSDCPIFVNSPALDDPDSRFLLVYRVPPGHCLNIYSGCPRLPLPRCQAGPVDPNSVRISFAKGWGPKYSRQEITACPVWLEVLMAPCR